MLAPRGTPKATLDQLSQAAARILELPDVVERFQTQGAVAKPSSPQQFDAFIRAETEKLGKIIRTAEVRAH